MSEGAVCSVDSQKMQRKGQVLTFATPGVTVPSGKLMWA